MLLTITFFPKFLNTKISERIATHSRSSPSWMVIHMIDSQDFSVNVSYCITRWIQFSSNTAGYLNEQKIQVCRKYKILYHLSVLKQEILELMAHSETFAVVDTIFIMDSEMPIRNICPINYSQVHNKNTCSHNPGKSGQVTHVR